MKRPLVYLLCLVASASATSVAPHEAVRAEPSRRAFAGPIIDNVQIDHFHISPNSDGITDSMTITYALGDTATSVFFLILQKDSTTAIDTLVAGVPHPAGTSTAVWDGTDFNGSLVPEDNYLVFLKTQNTSASDSTYRVVAVDVTTPSVTITGLFPNPFAPGSPAVGHSKLTIEYDLDDPAPSTTLTVRVRIHNPTGSAIATLFSDTTQASTSTAVATWKGTEGGSTEGTYQVKIDATDRAGNSTLVYSSFEVDRVGPKVTFTDPQPGGRFAVVPDSLYGWTRDSNGIGQLDVRYAAANPYLPVTNQFVVGDTVFFAVPLADSITTEGQHTIQFRAVNLTLRETVEPFGITLDTTAPTTPILVQPQSPTKFPVIQLNGTVPSGTEYVRILRGGAVIDSVFHVPPAAHAFPYDLTLVVGINRITASAVDNTGNASPPSNEVVIIFENVPGLTIDQPFKPDDMFKVNLSRTASSTTVHIYDLGGQLVNALYSSTQSNIIEVPWEGTNGNFETVKRGPLVAVAVVEYVDGGSETFREIFLFQP